MSLIFLRHVEWTKTYPEETGTQCARETENGNTLTIGIRRHDSDFSLSIPFLDCTVNI